MVDKIMEVFTERFFNNDTILFISIGIIILFAGIKYLCKRIHGVDEISLKKADVRFADLERIGKVLDKLQKNSNGLFRRKAYEILFNKSVPYIEIEYLDLVMRYKDPVKSFRCLVSVYFYIDKTIKDKIKEKKYNKLSCIRNLKSSEVYIFGYFIFAMTSLLVLSISPPYLYKEFLKNTHDIDWFWLLIISYIVASIVSIPIFCIAKVMLYKSLAVNDFKWLSDENNLEVMKEETVQCLPNDNDVKATNNLEDSSTHSYEDSNDERNLMDKLKLNINKLRFW